MIDVAPSLLPSGGSNVNLDAAGVRTDTVAGATGTSVFELPGRHLEVKPWGAISVFVIMVFFCFAATLGFFRAKSARASFRAARAELLPISSGLGVALITVVIPHAKRERKAAPPPLQLKGHPGDTVKLGAEEKAPKVSVDIPQGDWRFSVAGDIPARPFAGFQSRESVVVAEGVYDEFVGQHLRKPSGLRGHIHRASGPGGSPSSRQPAGPRPISFWQRPAAAVASHLRKIPFAIAVGSDSSNSARAHRLSLWGSLEGDGKSSSDRRPREVFPSPRSAPPNHTTHGDPSPGLSYTTGSAVSAQELLRTPPSGEIGYREGAGATWRAGYNAQTPVVEPFSHLREEAGDGKDQRYGMGMNTGVIGRGKDAVLGRIGPVRMQDTVRPGLTRKNTRVRSPIGGTMSSGGTRNSSFFPT